MRSLESDELTILTRLPTAGRADTVGGGELTSEGSAAAAMRAVAPPLYGVAATKTEAGMPLKVTGSRLPLQ